MELGDQPEPTTEPPERFPGGVDALEDEEKYGEIPDAPLTRDLESVKNPAIDEAAPDELQEPEESQDPPTSDGASDLDRQAPV